MLLDLGFHMWYVSHAAVFYLWYLKTVDIVNLHILDLY